MGFLGTDTEVVQLNVGLRPGQCERAVERRRVAVPVGQIQHLDARRRDHRPERHARGRARWDSQSAAEAEHRVQHGADGAGQRLAVHHGERGPDPAAASEEARAVGLELWSTHGLAFDHGEVRCPGFGFFGRPTATGGEEGGGARQVRRLHEQLGERGMCGVGSRRRQYDFAVRSDVDLPDLDAEIGDRHPTDLRVVLRGHRDLERCDDGAVVSDDLRPTLGEGHLVSIRLDTTRLVAGGPHFTAASVPQEDVAARRITCDVLAPTCHSDVSPAAVS